MSIETISGLEFEFSLKPSAFEGLSHLLIDFSGQALAWQDDSEVTVARIKGHRLDLASARHHFDDLQELFDSISPEISDLGAHIISGNDCYVECCSRDEAEATPCSGLVYIDELVVEKGFRRMNIGTEMLKRMSEVVDLHKTLVALKAYPITDDGEIKTPLLKKSVKGFYSRLGFRHSGEHYMVKDARDCYAQRARSQY
jgi:GNAT superfamily N-acetyltransferase